MDPEINSQSLVGKSSDVGTRQRTLRVWSTGPPQIVCILEMHFWFNCLTASNPITQVSTSSCFLLQCHSFSRDSSPRMGKNQKYQQIVFTYTFLLLERVQKFATCVKIYKNGQNFSKVSYDPKVQVNFHSQQYTNELHTAGRIITIATITFPCSFDGNHFVSDDRRISDFILVSPMI